MTQIHYVPPTDPDARQHILSSDCWCGPATVEVKTPDWQEQTVTHNAVAAGEGRR
jgi:hypothetical protein